MTRVDLAPYLRQFWAAGDAGFTVAANAASMGRVSGVFNQPAEAGLAYGIAGLAACYVWRDRPGRMYIAIIPIILGGVLSVSKVFIFGGLPLILWHIWRSRARHGRLALVLVSISTILGIAQSGYATQWSGLDYLGRTLHPQDQNWLTFYSAGRLGTHNTLTRVIDEVARLDPWFGVGAGGLSVPYDNGWVEAFVVAGLVGVTCYTLALVWMWRIARQISNDALRQFLYALLALSTGASFGVPALDANRSSTLLWVVLSLCASTQMMTGPRIDLPPPILPEDYSRAACPAFVREDSVPR